MYGEACVETGGGDSLSLVFSYAAANDPRLSYLLLVNFDVHTFTTTTEDATSGVEKNKNVPQEKRDKRKREREIPHKNN